MRSVHVIRKPLTGSILSTVSDYMTGGLNIDRTRVPLCEKDDYGRSCLNSDGNCPNYMGLTGSSAFKISERPNYEYAHADGRFPANLILQGHAVAGDLENQGGVRTSGTGAVKRSSSASRRGNQGAAYGGESRPEGEPMIWYGDTGSAARYFKQIKW